MILCKNFYTGKKPYHSVNHFLSQMWAMFLSFRKDNQVMSCARRRSIFLPKYFSHKSSCQISLDSITSKDWNILSKINHSFQGERKQLFCNYLFVRLSICIKHTIFVDWLLCQVFVNFHNKNPFLSDLQALKVCQTAQKSEKFKRKV